MNYFICGFTGAGKSTLLKELSQDHCLLHYRYIDLDEYILAKFPEFTALGDLIRQKGFPFFRRVEEETLHELTEDNQSYFVALGGGTLTENTLKILRDWKGFWLNTDFETCYKRIKNDKNRPLSERSREELLRLYEEREKLYKKFPVYEKTN